MPVFPLSQFPDAQGRFEISAEERHHLQRVLRIKPGKSFDISLPDGRRAKATWIEDKGRSYGQWLEEIAAPLLRNLPVWLGIGLIRMSRLEWLVEKATELGAERISLLQMSHSSIPKGESISDNKIKRLKKISQETLKQCERNAFTEIEAPQTLGSFLKAVRADSNVGPRLLLLERSKAPLLPHFLENKAGLPVFLIGPEGGVAEEERILAESAGFKAASLGPGILRSETAAIAALSYLHLQVAAGGKDR